MGPHPGLPGMGPAGAGLLAFGAAAGLAAAAGAGPGSAGAPHSASAAAAAAAVAAAQAHPMLKPGVGAVEHARREEEMVKAGIVPEERLVSSH